MTLCSVYEKWKKKSQLIFLAAHFSFDGISMRDRELKCVWCCRGQLFTLVRLFLMLLRNNMRQRYSIYPRMKMNFQRMKKKIEKRSVISNSFGCLHLSVIQLTFRQTHVIFIGQNISYFRFFILIFLFFHFSTCVCLCFWNNDSHVTNKRTNSDPIKSVQIRLTKIVISTIVISMLIYIYAFATL